MCNMHYTCGVCNAKWLALQIFFFWPSLLALIKCSSCSESVFFTGLCKMFQTSLHLQMNGMNNQHCRMKTQRLSESAGVNIPLGSAVSWTDTWDEWRKFLEFNGRNKCFDCRNKSVTQQTKYYTLSWNLIICSITTHFKVDFKKAT